MTKKLSIILVLVLLCGLGAFFNYALPKHQIVVINGVEVKRMDSEGVINAENPAEGPTRDVFFLYTEDPRNNKVHVFRNEDTGWGFPWFFKFNSADVQARAHKLSKNDQQLALITYYGWRIQMFSSFPNVLKVEATDTTEEPFPWFNVVFLLTLSGLIAFIAFKIRAFIRRKRGD